MNSVHPRVAGQNFVGRSSREGWLASRRFQTFKVDAQRSTFDLTRPRDLFKGLFFRLVQSHPLFSMRVRHSGCPRIHALKDLKVAISVHISRLLRPADERRPGRASFNRFNGSCALKSKLRFSKSRESRLSLWNINGCRDFRRLRHD